MKKKILLSVIILETIVIFILGCFNIRIKSWGMSLLFISGYIIPTLILIQDGIKSPKTSVRKTKILRFLFWWLLVAFVGGAIGVLFE